MRILSGMRPTGKMHLGHLAGALSKWVELQKDNECFFMVADWHALMSEYKNPGVMKESSMDNVIDWLAVGIDPQKSCLFVQSQVLQHLELFTILGIITPLGWLYRCPTYKEQMQQLKEKEIANYGFLGYPVLQTADIIVYRAEGVPVGEDQLSHLEIAREIVRRFHFLYDTEIFPEPQALLTPTPRLMGIDGRKMSKSYQNTISLSDTDKEVSQKIMGMFTDPQRIKKTDPGHPLTCNVFSYYKVFKPDLEKEVMDWCQNAKKGCTECKKNLAKIIMEILEPIQEKRRKIEKKTDYISDIIKKGNERARNEAELTMQKVREVLKLV